MIAVARRTWVVAPRAPDSLFAALPDLHPAAVQVLFNRGLHTVGAVRDFLAAASAPLSDPFALPDMHAAVTRIRDAIRRGERVAVHGDYDVDGITGTVLLTGALEAAGLDVMPILPRRDTDGYGIQPRTLEELAVQGCRLVVTVDTGTSALAEVALAADLGLDVIVTDHHVVNGPLPPACAVINPQRRDVAVPPATAPLAGVGVAFKLAQAIELAGLLNSPGYRTEQELDLVAIGTVVDVAPVVGENRSLVHRGLARLRSAPRPGIRALVERAGLAPEAVDAGRLSFALGPRLNAPGRLGDPHLSFELLRSTDAEHARRLAADLDELNARRQDLTASVLRVAREVALRVEATSPVLVVSGQGWAVGVVGLVAARLAEDFDRPAFVIASDGDASRGSARAAGDFDVMAALRHCQDLLRQFGGHRAAAGFALDTGRLTEFADRLRLVCRPVDRAPGPSQVDLEIDWRGRLGQSAEAWALHHSLEPLAPFGQGNPAPLFLSHRLPVRDRRLVGERHARLKVECGRQVLTAFGPRLGERLGSLTRGAEIDAVYTIGMSSWNGAQSLELTLVDAWSSE